MQFRLRIWESLNEELVRKGEAAVAPYPQWSDILPMGEPASQPDQHYSIYRRLLSRLRPPPVQNPQSSSGIEKSLVKSSGARDDAGYAGVGFDRLYRRLLKLESVASKSHRGMWSAHPVAADRPLLVRLWYRFRINKQKMG